MYVRPKLTFVSFLCFFCAPSPYSNLKSHKLVHSKEWPFVCKQCNYSCTQAGDLKKHMLSANPFRRKALQLHDSWQPQNANAHIFREKPFSSTQCNYSCTTASCLTSSSIQKRSPSGVNCVTILALELNISLITHS